MVDLPRVSVTVVSLTGQPILQNAEGLQKAVTGSFSVLCLTRKSPFQDGSEIGFGCLWVLLIVIANSMLRKNWGSHPGHGKMTVDLQH